MKKSVAKTKKPIVRKAKKALPSKATKKPSIVFGTARGKIYIAPDAFPQDMK